MVHIPNGVVLDGIEETDGNGEIEKKVLMLQQEGYFVVGYAGGLSISNAIMDLVEAAELLREQRIAFVIIGEGIEKPALIRFKDDNELENVYFMIPFLNVKFMVRCL